MLAVVIPAYNRGEQLARALNSLAAQTMNKFIVVVSDDASTENIKQICETAGKSLQLVYLRSDVNGGPGAARQKGLDWCFAHNIELVTFLDSDDVFFPNALEVMTYEMNHARLDLYATDIAVEHKHEPQTIIKAESSTTWMHGKMYRVSYLQKIGLNFDTNLRTNEDLAFNLSAIWNTISKSYTNVPVYLWRDDNSSITRTVGELRNQALGADYIRAIYSAFKFNIDRVGFEGDSLIPNLFCCYNYYQIIKGRDGAVPKEIDDKLTEMILHRKIQDYLRMPAMWKKLEHNIQSYAVMEDKRILDFKETFIQWYKAHGGYVNAYIN